MDLAHKKCVPCEGGVDPMPAEEVEKYLHIVSGWSLFDGLPARPTGGEIRKDYTFKDFAEAMQFVNKVGEIAQEEDHHPDIFLHSWNKVELHLSTHAIHGLHINDFVLATKVDEMWKEKFKK